MNHEPTMPHSSTADTPALDYAQMFQREGLAIPPLPADLAGALSRVGPFAFSTLPADGGPRIAAVELGPAIRSWLGSADLPWASVSFVGYGLASTAVRLCLATPKAGFFIRKRWSEALGHGDDGRDRIQATFNLLQRALAESEAPGAPTSEPDGRRLLVIDDDFKGTFWGWVPRTIQRQPELWADPMAWSHAIFSLKKIPQASWI